MNLNLQDVSVNGNGNVADYSLQQSQLPNVQAVSSKRVEKPQAQSAVSPTVINLAPSHVFQARNSPDSAMRQQRKLPSESLQPVRISVQPSNTPDGQFPPPQCPINYHFANQVMLVTVDSPQRKSAPAQE